MAKKTNTIKITKEKRVYMISEIKNYFFIERNEDLGDLASVLILDFITEKIAPEFYNQGVLEAYKYMNERVEDMLSIQR